LKLPAEPRIRSDLAALLEAAGETPGSGALDLLATHVVLLARWNPRYNLTRISSWAEILDRHVRESLLPLRWIGGEGRMLDIGTGNGYPAIPILACRPALEGTLVERSEKKSLFLEAVLREGGRRRARVQTRDLAARSDPDDQPFDCVVSRATLTAERYLEIAATWVRPGGRVFLYAGGSAEAACANTRAHGLAILSRDPIPRRRDSYLFVLQTPNPAH
jgi:16S rRNA (guanine527-N7)-methyltransferase